MFRLTDVTCCLPHAILLVMEEFEVEQIIRKLATERESARRQIEVARKRLNGFDMAITGYLQVFPNLRRVVEGSESENDPQLIPREHPRGQAAISEILEAVEYRGKYWTVAHMTEELQRRGWEPESEKPSNSVRVALTRLAESNSRILKGPGEHGHIVYYYHSEDSPPPRFHKGEVAARSSRV